MNIKKIGLSLIVCSGLLLLSGCNEKNEVHKEISQENLSIKKIPDNKKQNIKIIKKEQHTKLEKQKIENVVVNSKQISKKDPTFKVKKTTNKIEKIKKPAIKLSRKSCESDKINLDDFKFDFIKKGIQDDNTLLVVGGIQGDEPGGFMAASLLSTHYDITKGSVWIVPNLNFYSIIKRSRGPYGDMNRKFADLPKSDPEYKIIQRIKSYIRDPYVKLILNLHDGSGFYRPMYIDRWHQPLTWGQSSVIDQDYLSNVGKYNDTYHISEKVVNHINQHLLKQEDMYRTKNTHTRFNKTFEEKEMSKTLTYYAVTHGKAAFGHETSKSLNVAQRVYYKMLAIEKYMDIMGIEYSRKFPLTLSGVKHALDDDISITFDDTHIKMPLANIRNIQKYFPVKSNGIVSYFPSNPLIKIIKNKNIYTIYYGNRRLTKLVADYSEHINYTTAVPMKIDGVLKDIKFGDTVNVKKNFMVVDEKKFRVNVIGYTNKSKIETNKLISKDMFIKKYSVEKNGKLYRVEFYKKDKFAGMILVNFEG